MKSMKNTMIAALIALGTIGYAQPPEGGGPGGRPNPGQMMERERMAVLGLDGITEEQKTQVEQLYAEMKTKVMEFRKDFDGTPEEARPQMKAFRDEKDQKLETILNEDQLKALNDLRDQHRKQRREGGQKPQKKGNQQD